MSVAPCLASRYVPPIIHLLARVADLPGRCRGRSYSRQRADGHAQGTGEPLQLVGFRFNPTVLDFGQAGADPDFHIIYGPNEAGKTSTLRTIARDTLDPGA